MFTSEKAIQGWRLNVQLMSGWKRMVPQILAGLGLAMALAGCEPVQSVFPFFDSKEVIFEPRLVGEWKSIDGGTTFDLSFVRAAENSNDYAVTYSLRDDSSKDDEPREAEFSLEGRVFKINDVPYLDLVSRSITFKPIGNTLHWGVNSGLFTAPTHTVHRVWLSGDQLKLAYLDDDRVKRFVGEKDLKVAAESTDFFLLIAPTRELQSQILANAEDEELLDSDGLEFARQK
jgi:hypothetical protein